MLYTEILDPEVLEYLENHPSASGRRPTDNQQSSANNAHVSGRTSSSSGNGRRSATSRGRTTRSSGMLVGCFFLSTYDSGGDIVVHFYVRLDVCHFLV